MVKTSVSKFLAVGTLAVSLTSVNATATLSQSVSDSSVSSSQPMSEAAQPELKVTFVCATNNEPPTTYAIAQNGKEKAILSPVFRWQSEYLVSGESAEVLCQKMAQKMQNQYDRGESLFVAYEPKPEENRWQACLVPNEGQKCNENGSEQLFSLNTRYGETPKCFRENIDPQKCTPPTRGPLLSIPASKPGWFSFIFR